MADYKTTSKDILPFISNEKLVDQVTFVLEKARQAQADAESKLFSNVVDPFSALFEISCKGIDVNEWLELEKSRQTQKTLQNFLGTFHQEILASMPGWKQAPTVVDLINEDRKIIAEVKNKYNTTKGNHKMSIYRDIEALQGSICPGYTGYYVEVIPSSKARYDKPFTPSDNRTKCRLPLNEKIRVIDGYSFYALASGYPDALRQLYKVLPIVIGTILGKAPESVRESDPFNMLFNKVY